MNKAQKEVLTAELKAEQKQLKWLEQVYKQAQKDTAQKIKELQLREQFEPENLQTIIYQKKYQQIIQKQIEDTLNDLHKGTYQGISDYLEQCYEDGYIGEMYNIHQQGIPIISPIDQKQVVQAIMNDSKLSQGLYKRLGEDIHHLKLSVKAEVSRGIVTGLSWNQVATNIANGMNSPFHKAKNRAMTIVRTEGGRVQSQARYDAGLKAKEEGCDIVKQWDSTLDDRTRPSHQLVDSEIRELEEPFSNGLLFPRDPNGSAVEVINCRCALLQRPRWALDGAMVKRDNFSGELLTFESSESYEEFKKDYWSKENIGYMKFVDKIGQKYGIGFENMLKTMSDREYNIFIKLFKINPLFKQKTEKKPNGWDGLNYAQNYSTKKQAIKSLMDNYGIKFKDSRKYSIDEQLLCDCVSWMDSFKEKYPEFVELNPRKLPELNVLPPSKMKNAVGFFEYYTNGLPVQIALNGKYHTDMKVFEEYEKRCVKNGWTVANATTHKTFVHEYGHYVSNSLRGINGSQWEHDFIQSCVDEYKLSHPEYKFRTYIGLKGEVSRYATHSESEMFAECFAEYFGGENPREFATIFGTKLESVLKGVK